MDRTEGAGHVDGLFVAEDPAINRPPTEITAEWLNGVQEELIAAIEGAGLTPDAGDTTQLHQAIQAIAVAASFVRLASGAPLPTVDIGVIWHDAYASLMTWRTIGSYVGYASIGLGRVEYYDSIQPPAGWLKCNGATLPSAYAALIAYRGSAVLRDLRGEFLRGFDDGRGVDAGRAFGSAQADAYQDHYHSLTEKPPGLDAISGHGNAVGSRSSSETNTTGSGGASNYVLWHASRSIPANGTDLPRTAPETRARNIAILACIKY